MKFGTGQRQSIEGNLLKKIPGPGNYENTFGNVAKSAPKYGFGTGER